MDEEKGWKGKKGRREEKKVSFLGPFPRRQIRSPVFDFLWLVGIENANIETKVKLKRKGNKKFLQSLNKKILRVLFCFRNPLKQRKLPEKTR